MKSIHMTYKIKLIIIFILALIVRTGILIRHHHTYYVSGLTQGLLARNIIKGKGLVVGEEESRMLCKLQEEKKQLIDVSEITDFEDDIYYPQIFDMPGHGILLAGIWKLTNNYRYIYVQVLQILIDSLMVFLLFLIVKDLFGEKSAVITAFLYSIYLPQAFLSVHPLRDCWPMFIGIIVIYLIIQYFKYSGFLLPFLAGLIIGIGAYLRPNVVYLAIFCSIFAVLYLGKKRAVRLALISSIVVIFLLLPWWVRNYRIYHKFIPLSANFGAALWGGLGIVSNPYGFEYSDAAADKYVQEMGYNYRYGTPEFSDVLLKKTLKVIKTHPFFYLKTILYRIPKALIPGIPWGIEPKDFNFVPKWSFYLWKEVTGRGLIDYAKAHPFIFGYKLARRGITVILFILALLGIWLKRKQYVKVFLLISIPFYFILIHSTVTYPNDRYLLPGTWVYLVFSAVFIENLWERWKQSRQTRFETGEKE